jgi:PAS domain S-box-containing protein
MVQSRKTNDQRNQDRLRLRTHPGPIDEPAEGPADDVANVEAPIYSEALHHDVMSVVSDAVLIADDAGRLTYVSPNVHFIFGYAPEDVLKKGRIGFLLPGDLYDPDLLEQRGEIANIGCQIRDAVGRARNLLVSVRRIDRHGGTVLLVCRDVTERIKIEQDYELLSLTFDRRVEEQTRELRESRERYRRLVEGVPGEYYFYATDPVGTMTYISPSVHTILGYLPTDMVGHNWREFIDPNDPLFPELEKNERKRIAGLPMPLFYANVLHANGGTRLLEIRDTPVRDADGRVVANEGIVKDVTERQQAEQVLRRAHEELEHRVQERTAELKAMNDRLRDSEHRYRSVVEDQLEYIVRWRGEGVRTFVNESYCRSRNTSPEQLIGTSFMPSIVEADRDALQQRLAMVSVEDPVVVSEQRIVKPDGRVVWERWSNRALFDDEGNLIEFQSVGSDVTERRNQEKHAQDRALAAAQLRALSDRECDVMRLVVGGDANKVIARKLDLSIKTIEKHRSSLMKKLHIRSVPELVRLALLVEDSGETS